MAQYLKKKIKTSSKKRKNVIKYEEVQDDQNFNDDNQSTLDRNEEDQQSENPNQSEQQITTHMIYSGNIYNDNQKYEKNRNSNANLFQNVDISNSMNIEENKYSYDPNNIRIESDAWPEQQESVPKSKVHKLLRTRLKDIDPKKIYFEQLQPKHIKEIKNLHEEWFPLSYPDSFFERIKRQNVIGIGCFIDLDKQNKRVILGSIMAKINNGNADVNDIYKAKEMNGGGITGWLSATLSCREYTGAYIMTLGVVDECRRFGLGTKLLNQVIKVINDNWMNCEVIYLHVVDYNEGALKFYERNDFRTLKRIKDHYVIFEKLYDGLLLYKDIKVKNEQDLVQPNPDNEKNQRNINDQLAQNQSGILSYITSPLKSVYQKIYSYYNYENNQ